MYKTLETRKFPTDDDLSTFRDSIEGDDKSYHLVGIYLDQAGMGWKVVFELRQAGWGHD